MYYLDTSLLVSAMTNERRTKEMQQWLVDQDSNQLLVSDWVITEFSAALSIKLRTNEISSSNRADALAVLVSLTEQSFTRLSISSADFQTAARFVDQYLTGLRAGDALHLAVAANHGARITTLDKGLAKAADSLDVSVLLL